MYKSKYKSVFRIHTIQEALKYELTSDVNKTDLFLYLLDTYDVLLSHSEGMIPILDENNMYLQLAQKLEMYSFVNHGRLQDRIPGQLKGWCEGMFVYICIAMCRWLASSQNTTVIQSQTRSWMCQERIRTHVSFNTTTWTIYDCLMALDTLEYRWSNIQHKNEQFLLYMDAIEARIALFITHMVPFEILNIDNYRMGNIKDNFFQVHPKAIYECYIRCTTLRRSYCQYHMFDVRPGYIEVPENRWNEFIKKEERHLGIRKFRDNIANRIWDLMLRVSETNRTSYNARGSRVSAYQSLAENRALGLLDSLNKKTAYAKPEEIRADKNMDNALYIQTVHAFFMSTFSISFIQYFLIFEEQTWKHRLKIPFLDVPVVIVRSKRYDILHKGIINLTKTGQFKEAFLLWVYTVRQDYRGILYRTMDFSRICKVLFDPPEVKQQRQSTSTTYQWT